MLVLNAILGSKFFWKVINYLTLPIIIVAVLLKALKVITLCCARCYRNV